MDLSSAYEAAKSYVNEDNPPTVYLQIPSKSVSDIRNLKPGNEVHILIVGKLMSKTERKGDDPGFNGEIQVEIRKMAVSRDEGSLADLLDD